MTGASLALFALACAPTAAVRMRGYYGDRQKLAESVAALHPLPDPDWHFSHKATATEGGCAESFEEDEGGMSLDRQVSQSSRPSISEEAIGNPKTIYFNGLYGSMPGKGIVGECPALCEVTQDKEMGHRADAVLWNTGGYNHWTDPPVRKPPGQKWIFTAFFEPPNRQDYFEYVKRAETAKVDKNGLIDLTMTFHPKSDILWPIARLVPRDGWQPGMDLPTKDEIARARRALAGAPQSQEDIEKNLTALKADLNIPRPKILLAMVSNCVGARLDFLKHLQAFLPPGSMDIMGKCGRALPCPSRNEGDACHQDLFKQYKFFAAFENKRIEGYITEKFFRGFLESMVPLALGGRTKADYEALGVPLDAFVHVDDFANIKDLADYLQNLDDLSYLKFFSWRKYLRVATTMETRKYSYCKVCQELYKEEKDLIPRRESFGNDLVTWWFDQYKGEYITIGMTPLEQSAYYVAPVVEDVNLTNLTNLTGVNGTSWNFNANATDSNLTGANGTGLMAANVTSWNFDSNPAASDLAPPADEAWSFGTNATANITVANETAHLLPVGA